MTVFKGGGGAGVRGEGGQRMGRQGQIKGYLVNSQKDSPLHL